MENVLDKTIALYFKDVEKKYGVKIGYRLNGDSMMLYATRDEKTTIFGTGIDIYLRRNYGLDQEKERKMEINHGSTGSFDPDEVSTASGAILCEMLGVVVGDWNSLKTVFRNAMLKDN